MSRRAIAFKPVGRIYPFPWLLLLLLFAPVQSCDKILSPLPASEYDPDQIETKKAQMTLNELAVSFLGNTYRVQIYTYPNHRPWGEELAKATAKLLPYLGNRLGIPLMRETLLIAEDDELHASGWCSPEKGIRLRYPADLHDLAHQLLHLWYNPRTVNESWLYEGIAGFEGLYALIQVGYGDFAQIKLQNLILEGLRDRGTRDFPLEKVDLHRETSERYRFGFLKSTLYLGLLRAALGTGYERWVTTIASSPNPITMEEVKQQFLTLGRTPETLLNGWITPGPYESYSWADLADDDRDGIPNAYETFVGTRKEDPDSDGDGLSDGFEIFHRLDPLQRDTAGEGKPDLTRVGMAVDGLENDWSLRNISPLLIDREGDGTVGMDFNRVYATSDGNALYFRIDFRTPPQIGSRYQVEFLVDLDWDRKPDLVVVCNESNTCWYAIYRRNEPSPETGSYHPELRASLSRVLEIKIPLDLLRGIPVFRVNILFADAEGKHLYDHIGAYWQKLELQNVVLR